MKKWFNFHLSLVIGSILLSACAKDEAPQPGEKTAFNAYKYGELFVYRLDLCSDGSTNISIDGISLGDFSYVYNEEKFCGEHSEPRAGTILYRPTGTYLISASTAGGGNLWSERVEVLQGQCRYLGLRCNGEVVGDAVYTPTGTWTFWVDQSTCGNESQVNIEITGNNFYKSGIVNPVFESEVDCNNTLGNGFKVNMPVGDYSIYASELTGQQRFWDNIDITVNEGDCFTFQLWCN